MEHLGAIVLALTADALSGLSGGLLSERWLRRHMGPLVGFAAGALVAVSFLDLLPECAERLGTTGFALALASFSLAAIVEWHLDHHPGEVAQGGPVPLALLGSDALHNTSDGAAVAAAFLSSSRAGIAAAVAVIVHELPQEVGDYALLRASGMSRRRALLALFGVQLTAFAGAAVVLAAAQFAAQATAVAVAIAAGTFLYIGAADLLPEIRGGAPEDRRARRAGFMLGLVGMSAMRLLLS